MTLGGASKKKKVPLAPLKLKKGRKKTLSGANEQRKVTTAPQIKIITYGGWLWENYQSYLILVRSLKNN